MPALFAYLIALGLLLGGGYGALSWLAAPEPVKIVAKAKQKAPSTHTATISEPTSAKASPPEAVDSERLKPASNDKPQSSETEARVAASEPGAPVDGPKSTPDQQAVVQAEAAPAEVGRSPPQRDSGSHAKEESRQEYKQVNKHPVEAAPPANTVAAASAKPKRPPLREASRPSEKRALTLMTLRTIEFPDGRRVTQLIPYRDDRRAITFHDDRRAQAFGPGFGLGW
jgi:hypothetical protein